MYRSNDARISRPYIFIFIAAIPASFRFVGAISLTMNRSCWLAFSFSIWYWFGIFPWPGCRPWPPVRFYRSFKMCWQKLEWNANWVLGCLIEIMAIEKCHLIFWWVNHWFRMAIFYFVFYRGNCDVPSFWQESLRSVWLLQEKLDISLSFIFFFFKIASCLKFFRRIVDFWIWFD